jgi:uncharacterized protein (TIGR00730 family)
MAPPPPDRPPRLCVYCASHVGDDPAYARAAHELGRALGHRGVDLVFGGGHVGLMGIVANEAVAAGRHVIGVITEQLVDREVAHDGLNELVVVADMPARKRAMYDVADAFMTLPGGVGTMEEFFEVLCWGYLGLHPRPMGLANVAGYYDDLVAFLDSSVERGLCRPRVRELLRVSDDPVWLLDDLLAALAAADRDPPEVD